MKAYNLLQSYTWRMGWFTVRFDVVYGSGVLDLNTGSANTTEIKRYTGVT